MKPVALLLLFVAALISDAQDAPELLKEFRRGYTTTFSSKGHPKAKKLKMTVKFPDYWSGAQSNSDVILRKYVSEYGRCTTRAYIMVEHHDKPMPFSKADKKGFIKTELHKLAPPEAREVTSSSTTLQGEPVGILELTTWPDYGSGKCYARNLWAVFMEDDCSITLMFSVVGKAGTPIADVKRWAKEHRPLFMAIVNSVKIG